jgi:hypothetical protein
MELSPAQESQEQLAREYAQQAQAPQAQAPQESQEQLAREYAAQQPPTPPTGDYLSKTEDAIHSGAAFLGGHTLAAAGDQYKKTIAQAQATHDAAAKEFKAGNYDKAVAIIAAAHTPVPFKGLVSQVSQAALMQPTHTFDPVNGLQPNPNRPASQLP